MVTKAQGNQTEKRKALKRPRYNGETQEWNTEELKLKNAAGENVLMKGILREEGAEC